MPGSAPPRLESQRWAWQVVRVPSTLPPPPAPRVLPGSQPSPRCLRGFACTPGMKNSSCRGEGGQGGARNSIYVSSHGRERLCCWCSLKPVGMALQELISAAAGGLPTETL